MENAGWSVRVVGAEDGTAEVFARGHRLRISAPVSFDAEDRTLTALECLLGSLGGDLVSGFLLLAQRRRLPIDHAEAVVRGRIANSLSYLGAVGSEGEPAIDQTSVEVFVSSAAPESEVRDVWIDALARSPLANTFRRLPGFDIRLTVTA